MAEIDKLKEENAIFRVYLSIFSVINIGIFSWLFTGYENIHPVWIGISLAVIVYFSLMSFFLVKMIHQNINKVRGL